MKYNIKNNLLHKIIITITCCIVTSSTLYSQDEKQLVIGQQPVYKVAKSKGQLQ